MSDEQQRKYKITVVGTVGNGIAIGWTMDGTGSTLPGIDTYNATAGGWTIPELQNIAELCAATAKAARQEVLAKLQLYLEPESDPALVGGKTGDGYWGAIGFSKGRKDQAATVRRFIERESAAPSVTPEKCPECNNDPFHRKFCGACKGIGTVSGTGEVTA